MAMIDYGQVPAIKKPSFKNVRLMRCSKGGIRYCTNQKYIDNKYINSSYRSQPGFSLVGLSERTGRWKLLKVYGEW